MEKITRKKNADYSVISNVFLRDKKLSLKAKGLLALIMSLPEDWDFSIMGITRILKEGRTAVYSAITELKNHGYCSVSVERDARGCMAGTNYTFYEEPNPDIPNTEYPNTENPYSENPHTDNPTQINIDITNKRLNKIQNKDSENEFSPITQTVGIESSLFTEEKKEKISGQKEKRATTGTREVKKCTFADSRYSQFEDFAKCFTAPEFAEVDLVYYYHAVADWSAANDAKKVDWIATARGFIRRDHEAGKLHKMTPAQSVFGLDVQDAISFIKGDL